MASWKPKTVKDVVLDIDAGVFVLPVIQRRLVWDEEKMELLFDSLLKGNSFGGIMVLNEERDREPLFAFRNFSRDGAEKSSQKIDRLDRDTFLVIDGQQRLQSFFMALKGSYNGKNLFFNLFSTPDEYEFRFAANPRDLPASEAADDGSKLSKQWHSVSDLFERLREVQDGYQVSDELADRYGVQDGKMGKLLEKNIHTFYMAVLAAETVGISSVTINRSRVDEEKQRIVELFRRLNDGGTRLSSYDLVASVFKGFDYRMEQFFADARDLKDIHFYQDDLIKLIFLLQDDYKKGIAQVTAEDAEFAINNQDRIFRAIEAARSFLKHAGLYNYYTSRGRSAIPLYFIAYHLFHQPDRTADLPHLFDNFDTGNEDFVRIKRWLMLSLLNGVFSRNRGWIPYKTGVRKLLLVMQRFKGQLFPVNSLFRMYRQHPLRFYEEFSRERLPGWDRTFVFYLIYDQEHDAARDVDHIHPRYRLNEYYEQELINSIPNFQLLDPGTNRNDKRAKPLGVWIESGVADQTAYLNRHLIPDDPQLWEAENFLTFLEARAWLILEKVGRAVPDPVSLSEAERRDPQKPGKHLFDTQAIYNSLPVEMQAHPIMSDKQKWFGIYKPNAGSSWAGKYRKELATVGIVTVADFALAVVDAGLEDLGPIQNGHVYRFHHAGPDRQTVQLKTKRFGGYAWTLTKRAFKERGFDWQEYLVKE